jgi:hypothetical protein
MPFLRNIYPHLSVQSFPPGLLALRQGTDEGMFTASHCACLMILGQSDMLCSKIRRTYFHAATECILLEAGRYSLMARPVNTPDYVLYICSSQRVAMLLDFCSQGGMVHLVAPVDNSRSLHFDCIETTPVTCRPGAACSHPTT